MQLTFPEKAKKSNSFYIGYCWLSQRRFKFKEVFKGLSIVYPLDDGAEVEDASEKWNNENLMQACRTDMAEYLGLKNHPISLKLSEINSFCVTQQILYILFIIKS